MTAAQLHNNKIWGMPSIRIVLNMLQFSSLVCTTLDDGKIVPGTVLRREAFDRVVILQISTLVSEVPTFENGIFGVTSFK